MAVRGFNAQFDILQKHFRQVVFSKERGAVKATIPGAIIRGTSGNLEICGRGDGMIEALDNLFNNLTNIASSQIISQGVPYSTARVERMWDERKQDFVSPLSF